MAGGALGGHGSRCRNTLRFQTPSDLLQRAAAVSAGSASPALKLHLQNRGGIC